MFLLSTLDEGSSRATAGAYMVVLGAGIGMVMQVTILATQNSVDRADLGTATATVSFFRSVGGSVGVAVFGAVFTSRLATNLTDAFGTAPSGDVSGSLTAIRALPEAAQALYRVAFADALTSVFLLAVPAAGVAFVLTLLLREDPLRTSAEPGGVAAHPTSSSVTSTASPTSSPSRSRTSFLTGRT